MRNRLFVAVLLLLVGAGFAWSQFWKDMGDRERQTLGESYWLAGQQYEAVGKIEKGREHKALARLIWPDLEPSAVIDQEQPSAAELLASGRAKPIGGAADTVTPALNSFFLRFVGAILDEDAAAVAGFLDGSVYVSAVPVEMERAQAQAQLAALFEEVSLAGFAPSAVYDLDSIVISPAPQAVTAAAGEAYTLRVDSVADFSAAISFWEKRQQFFVRRAPEGWSIFAIGQTPPPAGFRPRRAAAVAAAPAPLSDAEASEAVTDAFTGCLSAFLAKNADGALAFMADEVTFLRLPQTVTREELDTTFLGYFETTDFQGAGVDDIVDTANIFVEPAASPVDGVSGRVYVLNAEALVDLSSTIPFLGKYQRYYFREDAGDWKIFAIL
jgi:hypothetical protein